MRFLFLLALCLTLSFVSVAQSSETCSAVVTEALALLDENCGGLERNNACYGYFNVEAGVIEGMGEAYFTQPADIAALSTLTSIRTLPLDLENNYWGLVAMNLQANFPTILPGQGAIMVLMGDAQIENAVPEGQAPLAEPLDATTTLNANLRSGPGTQYPVVGSFSPETALQVDGRNDDWLRVINGEQFGWVKSEFISPAFTAEQLPTLDTYNTPMQAFYFTTGIGQAECRQAPDMLMVQGPQRVAVDINANGADIRITSTIALRTLPDGRMQVIAVAGTAILEGGLRLPRGFTTFIQLDETGRETVGQWEAPRLLTPDEAEMVNTIGRISTGLLHYQPQPLDPPALDALSRTYGDETPEEVAENPAVTAEPLPDNSGETVIPTPMARTVPPEAPVLDPVVPGG